jgi:2-oxoglutarate ferredoxin oxidoreductase subunit beta
MIFGKDRNKGIRLIGTHPEVVNLGNGITADDLLIHDERAAEPTLAYLLTRMRHPEFPEPVGIFRDVDAPTYGDLVSRQLKAATEKLGPGSLAELFGEHDTWVVE